MMNTPNRGSQSFTFVSQHDALKPATKLIIFCLLMLTNFVLRAQEATPQATSDTKPSFKINWSGQINAFYLGTIGEKETSHSFSNGLLPASLLANPTWTKDDLTVSGTFGIYVGLNSIGTNGNDGNLGQGSPLAFSTVDVRQIFATVSHKKYGSLQIGRDFGLFGFDAIINDISLLGVGASYSPKTPQHTSLGGIGYGYIYCDRFTQFNYTTPSLAGLTLTVGGYQRISPFNPVMGQSYVETKDFTGGGGSLGFHAKLKYDQDFSDKKNNIYISASLITQKIDSVLQGIGYDLYAKLKLQGFNLSAYYYGGNGMGDIGLFSFGAIKTLYKTTNTSLGYYVQASYAFKSSLTFGVNYGSSKIADNDASSRVTVSGSYTTGPVIWRVEYTNINKQPTLGVEKANLIALGLTYAF